MVDRRQQQFTECARHVSRTLELSEQLYGLASLGQCEHDDCLLLDVIVRDCARTVRAAAVETGTKLARERASQRDERKQGCVP